MSKSFSPNSSGLEELVEAHKRRLHILEVRIALQGINARPEDLLEVEDIKKQIVELETQLAGPVAPTAAPSPPPVGAANAGPLRIFLSYAREDGARVEQLYQGLCDLGFKPWMDCKDILPGENWELAIKKAIRQADFFLACLSTTSINKRGWVQKELKKALDIWTEKLEDDIYLIPVRLDNCEAPESLHSLQWVNLFEKDGWDRLVRAIQAGQERRGK